MIAVGLLCLGEVWIDYNKVKDDTEDESDMSQALGFPYFVWSRNKTIFQDSSW